MFTHTQRTNARCTHSQITHTHLNQRTHAYNNHLHRTNTRMYLQTQTQIVETARTGEGLYA